MARFRRFATSTSPIVLALSYYSNEIPIMNDGDDTVDCSCTFQIETDKLGFQWGGKILGAARRDEHGAALE